MQTVKMLPVIQLTFTVAEISTILAALNHWEETGHTSEDDLIDLIATSEGRHPRADKDDIRDLSSRIADEASEQEFSFRGYAHDTQ